MHQEWWLIMFCCFRAGRRMVLIQGLIMKVQSSLEESESICCFRRWHYGTYDSSLLSTEEESSHEEERKAAVWYVMVGLLMYIVILKTAFVSRAIEWCLMTVNLKNSAGTNAIVCSARCFYTTSSSRSLVTSWCRSIRWRVSFLQRWLGSTVVRRTNTVIISRRSEWICRMENAFLRCITTT